jgi:hypothetical protein
VRRYQASARLSCCLRNGPFAAAATVSRCEAAIEAVAIEFGDGRQRARSTTRAALAREKSMRRLRTACDLCMLISARRLRLMPQALRSLCKPRPRV